jgi:hypothetical protein
MRPTERSVVVDREKQRSGEGLMGLQEQPKASTVHFATSLTSEGLLRLPQLEVVEGKQRYW